MIYNEQNDKVQERIFPFSFFFTTSYSSPIILFRLLSSSFRLVFHPESRLIFHVLFLYFAFCFVFFFFILHFAFLISYLGHFALSFVFFSCLLFHLLFLHFAFCFGFSSRIPPSLFPYLLFRLFLFAFFFRSCISLSPSLSDILPYLSSTFPFGLLFRLFISHLAFFFRFFHPAFCLSSSSSLSLTFRLYFCLFFLPSL